MKENIIDIIFNKLEKQENLLHEILDKLSNDKLDRKPRLIKIDEAARITGYSKKYIYNLTYKGLIPFVKKGKSIRFEFHELNNWIRLGNIK